MIDDVQKLILQKAARECKAGKPLPEPEFYKIGLPIQTIAEALDMCIALRLLETEGSAKQLMDGRLSSIVVHGLTPRGMKVLDNS